MGCIGDCVILHPENKIIKEYEKKHPEYVFMELFDKFVSLLGEEEIALKDYCELLDAGLEEAKVGVIPPSLDQVVAGDIERTRYDSYLKLYEKAAQYKEWEHK